MRVHLEADVAGELVARGREPPGEDPAVVLGGRDVTRPGAVEHGPRAGGDVDLVRPAGASPEDATAIR